MRRRRSCSSDQARLESGIGESSRHPDRLFQPVVEPGTVIGPVQSSIVSELDLAEAFPVIAVAEHDTASAVAAVPAPDSDFAYLSCGTWALFRGRDETAGSQ